ncbi:MAG TPA: MurT ligase domain-containing protein [Acidimicrobiales bacterium]|nr:MurT ligase domain-containing protein [Acidimicrobiales bacterium]
MPARARLAGRTAVAVSATSRRLGLGGGSVIGGRVGLLMEPDLLDRLAADRQVALVSGTNGKTTTTRLLAAALGGPSQVATSSAGANLPPGLAVALAASPPGAPAVLEVDEAYLGAVASAVAPRVVALLNLSRDQLDRVSEVRMVANRWRRALSGLETTVVANADDPLVAWAAGTASRVIWVAAGLLWHGDAVGCPSCDGQIVFSGTDASAGWSCPCGFARPRPDARLEGDALVTDDGRRLVLDLALPGRANRANAAVAAVAAGVLGVDEADALASMTQVTDVEGRFAVVTHGGVTARLLLAKNPAGWTELLDMLDGGGGPVVIGINARIADGHDPSWLWDVAFERLAGRLVVATGDRRRDLAVRLRYAGVAHLTVPDQRDALGASGTSDVDYVGNYTAFQDLRRQLAGRAHGGPLPLRSPALVPARPVPEPTSTAERSGLRSRPHRPVGTRSESALRVVVIYPDLLGTYGDGGNGRVLAARAAWRGIATELLLAVSDAPLPTGGDLYCIGGGEDGPQVQAAERLAGGALAAAVAGGATVLAVCAGYQIMGTSFPGPDGRSHGGLGLLDVDTVKGSGRRAVGEIVAEPLAVPGEPVRLDRLTGFENHAGVTRLGPSARPLARVISGVGDSPGSGTDGARADRVVGTYLHGPVLARNPTLADLLLALATGSVPPPLDDVEEQALHDERLGAPTGADRARAGVPPGVWRRLVQRGRT